MLMQCGVDPFVAGGGGGSGGSGGNGPGTGDGGGGGSDSGLTCQDASASGTASTACFQCVAGMCSSDEANVTASCGGSTVTCIDGCNCGDVTCLMSCGSDAGGQCSSDFTAWENCAFSALKACSSQCAFDSTDGGSGSCTDLCTIGSCTGYKCTGTASPPGSSPPSCSNGYTCNSVTNGGCGNAENYHCCCNAP